MNWITSTRRGTDVRTLCVLAGLAICGGAASAADWPQWGGPNRDHVSTETGLLKEWPDDGPKLLWQAKGLGAGYAAVAAVGERLYTLGEDASSSYLHAINAKDGKIAWSTKVGKVGGSSDSFARYFGPRATPTVEGDRIYVLGQWGDLLCVSAKDGTEVWRKNLFADFKGKIMSVWDYSESPLVDGDRLVVTPGGAEGALLALNKMTGEPVWRSKEFTDAAAYSSIIIADVHGAKQYIQATGESVVGVDPEAGKLLWRAARQGPTAVIPTPIYSDGHVFVTSGYGAGGHLFKISKEGDAFKAEQVYHKKDFGVQIGGVVLVEGKLYGSADPGILKCVDFLTGEESWKSRDPGKGAVVYADGHLYVRTEATPGTVTLVEADPEEYVEKGLLEQPAGSGKNTWSPPVIANGKLYLRDADLLFCYDIAAK